MNICTLKTFGCLALFSVLLLGCGGGAPYVGIWQCADNPDLSIQIDRFEEYFVITTRDGDKQGKREGTFADEIFSVGNNIVGQPMAFALDGDEITCTNPPNFCKCNSGYKKVDALAPRSSTTKSPADNAPVDAAVIVPDPFSDGQTILDRDPLVFEMLNGTVHVFHHATNSENEKRVFDWAKLEFYYMPQLALTKLAGESVAEVRQVNDEVHVFFRINARPIGEFELMENIHKAVNPRILSHLVVPLTYDSLTVGMPGSSLTTPVVVASAEFDLDSGALEISLPVAGDAMDDMAAKLNSGNEIVQAINNGSALPVVSFEIMQRLSTENSTDASSEPVTKTVNVVMPK
jgi:hypothetical protein